MRKVALEKAVELDPNYARAWAVLVELHFQAEGRDLTEALELDQDDVPVLLDKALTRPTVQGYEAQLFWLHNQRKFDEMKPIISAAPIAV